MLLFIASTAGYSVRYAGDGVRVHACLHWVCVCGAIRTQEAISEDCHITRLQPTQRGEAAWLQLPVNKCL